MRQRINAARPGRNHPSVAGGVEKSNPAVQIPYQTFDIAPDVCDARRLIRASHIARPIH
jgi:hypothetical protein